MLLRSMVLAAAAVGSCATSADAGMLVYSQSKAFTGELSPFAASLQFDQVNPDLVGFPGWPFLVIEAVILTVDSGICAIVAVENNGSMPTAGVGLVMTGFVSATSLGMSVSSTYFVATASGPLAGSDGVPGSGPDFHDFGKIGDFGTDGDAKLSGLDAFVGDGSFSVDLFASAGITFTGLGQGSKVVADFSADGVVTVDILYTIIPGPSVISLYSLGLLIAARRHRG